ncbi:glycosyltransferase family 4 protein [Lysinibacillus halotolerans]|uniref:glycosyltransferase family 4 protein n=1 Tax=Lysinibacillus halotolerans TaxID=1368476 RepID=UPI001F4EF81C|nr:glycosyltransferase family 4 protein [Lysinibacillus halotolerans]
MSTKVLMITQNFYPEIGSASNRMKNIYQLLKEKGYEITVLTTVASYPNQNLYKNKDFWNDMNLNEAQHIHRVTVKKRKYSLNMISRLLFYLEFTLKMIFFVLFNRGKYDIVFVSSPPIFIGIAGVIAKFRYRAKMVLDIRDLWPESLKGVGVFNYTPILWFFTRVEKFLYKKSDAIVVNSPRFSKHIQQVANIPEENIIFLPNAAREFEIHEEIHDDKLFKAIYTGNIGLAQDVDFLKSLAKELDKEKVHLSIVGYGMKREELKQFVAEQQLNHISFIAPTTREECLVLNRQHDVGILALTKNEVFDTVLPGKLIDYMTSGLPLIASVSGFSKQLIEKYNVGYITESRDAKEIVEHILYLKNHPNTRMEMKSNSIRLVRNHFYWEKNILELINLFGRFENSSKKMKSKVTKVEMYE